MFKGLEQQSITSVIAPTDLLHMTAVYLSQTALVSQTIALSAESHAQSVKKLVSQSAQPAACICSLPALPLQVIGSCRMRFLQLLGTAAD